MLSAAGQTPGPVLALQDEISASYDATATAKLSLRMARLNPAAAVAGPLLGRGVAVAVTRAVAAPLDTAVISLSTRGGLEQSLRLLAPLGVTAANLTAQTSNLDGLNLPFDSGLATFMEFEVVKPASELPRFIDALANLGATAARDNVSLSFSAFLRHSDALRARERDKALPGLLVEARRRAEPLARLLNLPLVTRRPEYLASAN